MGLFGGLFEKKQCDFCGGDIGMLGNKKYAEGNMCKECASKLSPWFQDRKQATKQMLEEQLAYREANRQAVAQFQPTRTLSGDGITIGSHTKLMIDDNARKFMVAKKDDYVAENPDVIDFSQAAGCRLDLAEDVDEIMDRDDEGKSVSYNPPRYKYSYDFIVRIQVNSPYFNEIKYSISNGYKDMGEQRMSTGGGWNVVNSTLRFGNKQDKFNSYMNLGNEIKSAIDNMIMLSQGGQPQGAPMPAQGTPMPAQGTPMPVQAQPAQGQPAQGTPMPTQGTPKFCPNCGQPLTAGAKFCTSCGGQIA